MKYARKIFRTILAVLLMGVVISAGSRAFAEVGGISDSVNDLSMNLSMGVNAWSKEKPAQTQQALSWETSAGKSYLIPALEIPAFLLLLNGYDRLAYPNSVEPDGKKLTTRTSQPSGITSPAGLGG